MTQESEDALREVSINLLRKDRLWFFNSELLAQLLRDFGIQYFGFERDENDAMSFCGVTLPGKWAKSEPTAPRDFDFGFVIPSYEEGRVYWEIDPLLLQLCNGYLDGAGLGFDLSLRHHGRLATVSLATLESSLVEWERSLYPNREHQPSIESLI